MSYVVSYDPWRVFREYSGYPDLRAPRISVRELRAVKSACPAYYTKSYILPTTDKIKSACFGLSRGALKSALVRVDSRWFALVRVGSRYFVLAFGARLTL